MIHAPDPPMAAGEPIPITTPLRTGEAHLYHLHIDTSLGE
jgi:hypothetical protein